MTTDPHRASQCCACHYSFTPQEGHDRTQCLQQLQELIKTHEDRRYQAEVRYQLALAWWDLQEQQDS